MFAGTNSLLRFIPCLWVVIQPILTVEVHVEDEYETGVVLAGMFEVSWFTYLPAIFSLLVSSICIVFIISKMKKKVSLSKLLVFGLMMILSFDFTMVIADYLDNVFRINWHAF